jgi:hypothetical protein
MTEQETQPITYVTCVECRIRVNSDFTDGVVVLCPLHAQAEALRDELVKAEAAMDMLNGNEGTEKRFCFFCQTKAYTARVGVMHMRGCPIEDIRKVLAGGKDE